MCPDGDESEIETVFSEEGPEDLVLSMRDLAAAAPERVLRCDSGTFFVCFVIQICGNSFLFSPLHCCVVCEYRGLNKGILFYGFRWSRYLEQHGLETLGELEVRDSYVVSALRYGDKICRRAKISQI